MHQIKQKVSFTFKRHKQYLMLSDWNMQRKNICLKTDDGREMKKIDINEEKNRGKKNENGG